VLRPVTLAALATLIAATAATSACADEADSDDAANGTAGPVSVSAALAALPEDLPDDGSEVETFSWSDLERAAELAGVERPDAADQQAVVDYLNAITGGPTERGEPSPVAALTPQVANVSRSATALGEFRDEVGWDILDVDRFAEQYAPPDSVTVIEGDVDEESLSAALGEPEDGTWSVGTEGEIAVEEVSPARMLGEAQFLTLVPGGLAVTRSSDLTPAVRAVTGGDGDEPSVADDPQLAALGAALDDEAAYAAMVVRPGAAAAGRGAPQGTDICDQALPAIPDASATAIADDDGPVVLVAHAYGRSDDARTAADRLDELVSDGVSLARGQDWSELVTLDDVSVTGPDDTVVVARLRPTEERRAGIWRDLLVMSDGLVAGC
jgi:hypothetical protein